MDRNCKIEINKLKGQIRSICSQFTKPCEQKLNEIYELVRDNEMR